MESAYEQTVQGLCSEIDLLRQEVEYWRAKYQQERDAHSKQLDDDLKASQRGVADALMFALSVRDTPDGALIIHPEDRKQLAESWSAKTT